MVNVARPEELSLLILAHMASVDGSIHPTERDTILEEIKKVFADIAAPDEMLDRAIQFEKKSGKDTVEKMIEDNLNTLSSMTKEQKETLYILLFDVLNADGRVNEEETRTLRKLKSFFLS